MDNKLLEKRVNSLILSATTLKVAAREFEKAVKSFEDIADMLERDDIELSPILQVKIDKLEELFDELGFGVAKG